jgi:hypothetical protein
MLAAFRPSASTVQLSAGTKICIFGNSNIAALKLALRDDLFKTDRSSIVFWGLPAPHFRTITYHNGIFSTPHMDLVQQIAEQRFPTLPVNEFEAIVFHGFGQLVRRYILFRQERAMIGSDVELASRVRDWLEGDLMYGFARSVRADYNGRILMSPTALRSEKAPSFQKLS